MTNNNEMDNYVHKILKNAHKHGEIEFENL
jgi:hypothetical protein